MSREEKSTSSRNIIIFKQEDLEYSISKEVDRTRSKENSVIKSNPGPNPIGHQETFLEDENSLTASKPNNASEMASAQASRADSNRLVPPRSQKRDELNIQTSTVAQSPAPEPSTGEAVKAELGEEAASQRTPVPKVQVEKPTSGSKNETTESQNIVLEPKQQEKKASRTNSAQRPSDAGETGADENPPLMMRQKAHVELRQEEKEDVSVAQGDSTSGEQESPKRDALNSQSADNQSVRIPLNDLSANQDVGVENNAFPPADQAEGAFQQADFMQYPPPVFDPFLVNSYYQGDTIAKRVEQEKLEKIYFASNDLKRRLAKVQGRCDICTLPPPCKHKDAVSALDDGGTPLNRMGKEASQLESIVKKNKDSFPTPKSVSKKAASKEPSVSPPKSLAGSQEQPSSPPPEVVAVSPSKISLHQAKMNEILGSRQNLETMKSLDHALIRSTDKISPYSILRSSNQTDLEKTLKQLKEQPSHGIQRSTRAEILRQLALKQKVSKNPFLAQKTKLTREACDELSKQPLPSKSPSGSSPKLPALKGRIRNRRGEYQSIDFTQQKNKDWLETIPDADQQGSPLFIKDIQYAENRLRVIEKISKYREEKIKKEFQKLEEELRQEHERNRKRLAKEERLKNYHRQQKEVLVEYQKQKDAKAFEEAKLKEEEKKKQTLDAQMRKAKNQENKDKLRLYKEMKARQIQEDQRKLEEMAPGMTSLLNPLSQSPREGRNQIQLTSPLATGGPSGGIVGGLRKPPASGRTMVIGSSSSPTLAPKKKYTRVFSSKKRSPKRTSPKLAKIKEEERTPLLPQKPPAVKPSKSLVYRSMEYKPKQFAKLLSSQLEREEFRAKNNMSSTSYEKQAQEELAERPEDVASEKVSPSAQV